MGFVRYCSGGFCKHVRKCAASVTFLAPLTELDLYEWQGNFPRMMGKFPTREFLGWGFSTPSLRAQCIVGLHAKFPLLLSDLKLNWNVSTFKLKTQLSSLEMSHAFSLSSDFNTPLKCMMKAISRSPLRYIPADPETKRHS
jgi:hypothetical protein